MGAAMSDSVPERAAQTSLPRGDEERERDRERGEPASPVPPGALGSSWKTSPTGSVAVAGPEQGHRDPAQRNGGGSSYC